MTLSPRKVLIVEDDAAIREALFEAITEDGHAVECAPNGPDGVRLFGERAYDLVLLDVMLPQMSGYDVCRRIRETNPRVPILMLTAKTSEIDKVLGLELGADDYITKPFGVRELLARIHAAFRRSELLAPPPPAGTPDTFMFGRSLIDRKRFTATRDGATVALTARELQLLEVFARRKGEVLSRDQLLNAVWGINYLGTTRTLDQHVAQVRKKVDADDSTQSIKTVHGVGYQYVG